MISVNEIAKVLRIHHDAQQWGLFFEVPDHVNGGSRRADAIAVNLWASQGFAVHGYEVKLTRGDFLREMKQPEKAQAIMQYCHHWWLLTPKGLIQPKELPVNWGLKEYDGKKLRVKVKAERLTPARMDPAFLAALVRSAQSNEMEYRQGIVNLEVEARVAYFQDSFERQAEKLKRDYERALERSKCDEFQEYLKLLDSLSEYGASSFDVKGILKAAWALHRMMETWGGSDLYRLEEMVKSHMRMGQDLTALVETYRTYGEHYRGSLAVPDATLVGK